MILAVDGGNSKTDVALVDADGARARARARARSARRTTSASTAAWTCCSGSSTQAGLDGRRADVAQVLLAGVDFPEEEARAAGGASTRAAGPTTTHVGNDTFAVLRAGHRARLGRRDHLRRRHQLRRRRARRTARAVPRARADHRRLGRRLRRRPGRALRRGAQRGRPRPDDAARAARAGALRARLAARARACRSTSGAIAQRRLVELAPVVLGAAADDAVARRSATGSSTRSSRSRARRSTRLGLAGEHVEVVVGGGLMRGADARLLARDRDGLCSGSGRA